MGVLMLITRQLPAALRKVLWNPLSRLSVHVKKKWYHIFYFTSEI